MHVHTAGCGHGYTLHVHTVVNGKEYTMHVHTANFENGYTLHVHTVGGGERETQCTSKLLVVESSYTAAHGNIPAI